MEVERRHGFLDLRAAGRRLEGYAATFGTEARIGDFTETIAPGAFAGSLGQHRDVLGLVDHDPAKLLGRTRSGTLRLREDARGLAFEIDVPATSLGQDVLALAERGDLGGMSFAFTAGKDGEAWQGRRRELRAINLIEVSIVMSFPAYAGTSVHARSAQAWLARARLFMETIR